MNVLTSRITKQLLTIASFAVLCVPVFTSAQTPTESEVMARIHFSYTDQGNDSSGNPVPNGTNVLLPDGNTYADGDWFPLTQNGQFIVDSVRAQNIENVEAFEGLAVSRHGKVLRVVHVGKNQSAAEYELVDAELEIMGALIDVENSTPFWFEEHGANADYGRSDDRFDYFAVSASNSVKFGTFVNTGRDGLRVHIISDAKVNMLDSEDDELKVSASGNDPDATTFVIEDSPVTFTPFAFYLDTDDSVHAVAVNRVIVEADLPLAKNLSLKEFVSNARLVRNGDVISTSYNIVKNSSTSDRTRSHRFVFNTNGFVLGAEEKAELSFELTLEPAVVSGSDTLTMSLSGTDVAARTSGTSPVMEVVNLSGSARSETHTIASAGTGVLVFTTLISTDEQSVDQDLGESYGVFELAVDVTAVNGDVYIPATVGRGGNADAGFRYRIEDASGKSVNGGQVSHLVNDIAGVDTSGEHYIVREGNTATFEVVLTYTPEVSDQYHVQLLGMQYGKSAAEDSQITKFAPAYDFESDNLYIQGNGQVLGAATSNTTDSMLRKALDALEDILDRLQ